MPKQHDIFGHLNHRKKRVINTDKPKGYGENSDTPYYAEKFALKLKPILDTLDPETQLKVKVFRAAPGESINTVYLRITQAWKYLIDRMDTPDRKYEVLRGMIQVRKKTFEVKLAWATSRSASAPARDFIVSEDEDLGDGVPEEDKERPVNWREDLMMWASTSADPSPPIEMKIRLEEEDRQWVDAYLSAFSDIVIIRLDLLGYKVVKNSKLAAKIREERGIQ